MTFSNAYKVLLLFLIPVGGGIPAGVLLAKKLGIHWIGMCVLYFISDVILAFVFESIVLFFARASTRSARMMHMREAFKKSMDKMLAKYGINLKPLALVMITFGTDPMTGRMVTLKAGHGFISGWTLAILGDMLFFGVIMVSTLLLNNILGDGTIAAIIIMVLMTVAPGMVRRIRDRMRAKANPAQL
jgi:hypothetical protein